MNQNIWGPSLWFSLHTITMNYPTSPTYLQKQDYKNFFISLENVIPCNICKKNYKRHLIEYPINNYLNSRKNLSYWLIDLHNAVNAETGKKIISYDKVIEKYETIYNRKIFDDDDNNNININIGNSKYIKYMLSILILLVIIALIYVYKNK